MIYELLNLEAYYFHEVFSNDYFYENGWNEPYMILPNVKRVYDYIQKEDVVREGTNWIVVTFNYEVHKDIAEKLEEDGLMPIDCGKGRPDCIEDFN